jgi:hypothetical protein
MREVRCDACSKEIKGNINRVLSWEEDGRGNPLTSNKINLDLCNSCIRVFALLVEERKEVMVSEPVDPDAPDAVNPERCSSYTPSCQTTPCSDCDPSICLE